MNNNRKTEPGKYAGKRLVLATGLACIAPFALYAEGYLEVGPIYRGGMKISVQGGSRAADSGARAVADGTSGGRATLPGATSSDDGTALTLREFDNGYVGPSGWEWANTEGWTQYFAYDEPGQYNASADTLTFQGLASTDAARSRRTVTSSHAESLAWGGDQDAHGRGLIATLGYIVDRGETTSLAAQFRFGWMEDIRGDYRDRPAYRQDIERRVYESSVRREQASTYVYDTLGNPAFPAAPYAMTDPAGVGPLIASRPSSITPALLNDESADRLVGRSAETALSSVNLDIDAHMFTFQLGPRWMWQAGERVSLLLQPAFTMNLLDATARRTETFRGQNGAVLQTWSDHSDKQLWRAGMGIEGGVQFALTERWNLTAAAGYEWVDKYSFNAGPDRIRMDLSGYQGDLALGFSF